MKQLAQGTVQFQADEKTMGILSALSPDEQDSYINQAIQRLFALTPPKTKASGSASSQIRSELERLFGTNLGALDAQEAAKGEQVILLRSDTGEKAQCPLSDTLSILKSLRQPITPSEVWEIVASMAE